MDKTELLIADEVFLTGTAAKITPVKKIESTELNVERPIMNKLKSKHKETEGRSQDYDIGNKNFLKKFYLNGIFQNLSK